MGQKVYLVHERFMVDGREKWILPTNQVLQTTTPEGAVTYSLVPGYQPLGLIPTLKLESHCWDITEGVFSKGQRDEPKWYAPFTKKGWAIRRQSGDHGMQYQFLLRSLAGFLLLSGYMIFHSTSGFRADWKG